MRLSEAIRLGAMLRPQQAFFVHFDAKRDATCALGAAAEAVGILDTTKAIGYTGKAPLEWNWIRGLVCECPADCGSAFVDVDTAIIHLNNVERWTRERIADWVEQTENATAAHNGTNVVAASTQDKPQTQAVRAQ